MVRFYGAYATRTKIHVEIITKNIYTKYFVIFKDHLSTVMFYDLTNIGNGILFLSCCSSILPWTARTAHTFMTW